MRTRLVAVFGYKAPKEKGGGKFKVGRGRDSALGAPL